MRMRVLHQEFKKPEPDVVWEGDCPAVPRLHDELKLGPKREPWLVVDVAHVLGDGAAEVEVYAAPMNPPHPYSGLHRLDEEEEGGVEPFPGAHAGPSDAAGEDESEDGDVVVLLGEMDDWERLRTIARKLVDAPGWEWMPGMLAVEWDTPIRVVFVRPDAMYGIEDMPASAPRVGLEHIERHALPDLLDEATHGLILRRLVRLGHEPTGDPGADAHALANALWFDGMLDDEEE